MRKIPVLLVFCSLLCGCSAVKKPAPHPVVTSISITVQEGRQQEVLAFCTDEETSTVLTYLRMLTLGSEAPVNPVYVSGPMYAFSIQYSNGACQTLLQKGERYFMGSDGIWKTINSPAKTTFARILAHSQQKPAP